jgi:hypothetical protein
MAPLPHRIHLKRPSHNERLRLDQGYPFDFIESQPSISLRAAMIRLETYPFACLISVVDWILDGLGLMNYVAYEPAVVDLVH